MAIYQIDLDDEDISLGQKDPHTRIKNCPLFRAMHRKIPGLSHVSQRDFTVEIGDKVKRFDLPPVARKFVRMADTHAQLARGVIKADPNDVDQEPLKPISFQVHIT